MNVEVVAKVMRMLEDVGMMSDDERQHSTSIFGATEMRDNSGMNDQ